MQFVKDRIWQNAIKIRCLINARMLQILLSKSILWRDVFQVVPFPVKLWRCVAPSLHTQDGVLCISSCGATYADELFALGSCSSTFVKRTPCLKAAPLARRLVGEQEATPRLALTNTGACFVSEAGHPWLPGTAGCSLGGALRLR